MKKKSDLKKVFKKHWKLVLLDLTAFVLLIVNLTNLAQLWLSNQDSVIIAMATVSVVLSLVTSLRANNIFFKIVREDLREINVTYVDVQEPTFLKRESQWQPGGDLVDDLVLEDLNLELERKRKNNER